MLNCIGKYRSFCRMMVSYQVIQFGLGRGEIILEKSSPNLDKVGDLITQIQ